MQTLSLTIVMTNTYLQNDLSINNNDNKSNKYKKIIEKILDYSGVGINGDQPWDLQIHNEETYQRVISKGSLGFGESYMDGWWDCENLDQFFAKIIRKHLDVKLKSNWKLAFDLFTAKLFNSQSKRRAFQIAERHYDLDNDLFEKMLDKQLTYSCGYWKNVKTLEEAQENKLKLICEKIQLEPGMRVLDIGSGWGSFIKYASENYDVSCVGITVSQEQIKYTQENCKMLDIDVRLQDYRELNEKFDRVVSIGMFEHVGPKNYKTYMRVVNKSLNDDGIFLLQTIGGIISKTSVDPWINKYIFPNSVLPSIKQIGKAIEGLFVLEDLHNFSADYDKTLMSWYHNFNENWELLKSKYDDRFYRMWVYYLLSSAGSFRSRSIQLWQIVLSKNGVLGGYNPRY